MNNNNRANNNNRRRGRGNNRPQGGGGGGRGEQLNRIDSRTRGNAPQLLEKYRKLAQDAHLNGDRVTAEYYLQFADHYFRVIADTRVRQDEQRQRRDERPADDDGDEFEYGADNDFASFDQQGFTRREERRPERDERRPEREERRPEREEAVAEDSAPGEPEFEQPAANPFTRDNRATRTLPPRRQRREPAAPSEPVTPEERHGFDQDAIPPVIEGTPGSEGEAVDTIAPEVVPAAVAAPRRRGRRPKAADAAGGGPLEAVNG